MKGIALVFSLFLILLCASAPVASPKKVNLGYLRNDLHHLAAWVAMEKGFFRDEGIQVEVAGIFNAGPEEMSAFASRSIDAGYLGVAPSTTGVANKSARVKAVALANAEGSAIVVRRDSNISEVKDLAGKTIAIPGYSSVQDLLVRKALEGAGVDQKKVTIIVIKPPEMITALEAKQIDAFIAWEPNPSKAVTKGIGRILIPSSRIWKDHPCCIVAFEGSVYRDQHDTVKAFLRAHIRATDYIKRNPDEAVRIGMKYTGMDEETIREAMKNIKYQYTINEEDIREYADYLQRFGYLKPMDMDAFIREYLDTKTLKDVKK